MTSYVDLERLATMTRKKRGSKGLREAAEEIGNVSPSTLSRVENGKMPDMETFLKLCDWLEIPTTELIKNTENEVPSEIGTLDAIAIQLRSDKNLDPATANSLVEVVKAVYREFSNKPNNQEKE